MSLATDFLATYSARDHARESALLAKYENWAKQFVQPNGWTVIPADARPPKALQCVDNAMRSRVERYRIFMQEPEFLVAYIGEGMRNGMGLDRVLGQTFPVTVWTGEPIGFATCGSRWRVNSYMGTHMCQFYARINGREYTGRGFGAGMCIALRETAESRRKNPRAIAA